MNLKLVISSYKQNFESNYHRSDHVEFAKLRQQYCPLNGWNI